MPSRVRLTAPRRPSENTRTAVPFDEGPFACPDQNSNSAHSIFLSEFPGMLKVSISTSLLGLLERISKPVFAWETSPTRKRGLDIR
jgi:hypothetical protein